MLKKVLCFAVLATFASTASAGVMGHSLLSLRNIVVTDAGGTALTGSFVDNSGGSPDILIRSVLTDAKVSTSLTGAPDGSASSVISIVGDGPAPVYPFVTPIGSLPPISASSVNGSSSTTASLTYGGSFVDIVAGDPLDGDPFIDTPGFADTRAEFDVDTLGLIGGAESNIISTTNFDFTAGFTGTIRFTFDAFAEIELADDLLPEGFATSGSTSLSVGVTQSGANVPGSGTTDIEDDLNLVLFTPPAPVGTGPGVYSPYVVEFDIVTDNNYSLTINQTAAVSVGVVPEPSSFAAFGFLGLVTTLVRRRKR